MKTRISSEKKLIRKRIKILKRVKNYEVDLNMLYFNDKNAIITAKFIHLEGRRYVYCLCKRK
jgi:hypothetical protein